MRRKEDGICNLENYEEKEDGFYNLENYEEKEDGIYNLEKVFKFKENKYCRDIGKFYFKLW